MNTEPSAPDDEAPLAPGDLVGRWVLGEVLGRGASATVFAARHADLGRLAALKVLHHGAAFSADARARFLREGRAAAAMAHPHAVSVYDVAVHRGVPYLVMERVGGETLATLLEREGPLPVSRALSLLLPVADALAAAHDAGIVHRDVKPANIAVVRDGDRERAVLLDFGAARLLVEADGDLTRSRAVLGTPAYMAPEQALAARAATPACDQFAFAAVALEATSGARPYAGERWTECFAAAVRGEVQDVARVAPGLAVGLRTALARALSVDPTRRFASMRDLAQAMTATEERRRRWAWWPVAGAVAAVVGVMALWPRPPSPAPGSGGAGDANRLLRMEIAHGAVVAVRDGGGARDAAEEAGGASSTRVGAPPPVPGGRSGDGGRAPRVGVQRRRARVQAVVDAGAAPVVELGPNDAPILAH